MSVDHRRANVLISEQFPDGTDVIAVFYEVGCEVVQIMPMQYLHVGKVFTNRRNHGFRQHRATILTTHTATNQYLGLIETDILNTQRKALRKLKSTTILHCDRSFATS